MMRYLRVVTLTVILLISSCVYADTIPPSFLSFEIPPVEISGKLTITNTEFDFKQTTFDVHSWHFDKEQVHHLSNGKGMNLVFYHNYDSRRFKYWSQGTDDTLQASMMDNVETKNCYLLHQFSLVFLLKNILHSLSEKDASTLDWTPSADGNEGTLTLTKKTENPGFVMMDTSIYRFSHSKLISKNHYTQGLDTKKGTSEEPFLVVTQQFSDYNSVFSAIPMKGCNDYQVEGHERRLKSEWAYDRVTTIAEGLTANRVLNELARDLVQDRWPSQLTTSQLYKKEQRSLAIKRFVWIGLAGIGGLALLIFGVRYYFRSRRHSS